MNSYLKKDILEYGVKYPEKLHRLYKILALQSGNLVNKNELGNTLGITTTAIENYLFLLQKSFHIYLLKPFAQNVRKELEKN
jgi:predicted AAA+ superfamily ATPase